MSRLLLRTCVAALLLAAIAGEASAQDPASFYKGKTVTLVVGYGPGGGYDVYARVLARVMGKYIPGNPTVIVQNMPAYGSLRTANYLTRSHRKTAAYSALSRAAYRSWPRSRANRTYSSIRASSPGSAPRPATPTTPIC